MAQQLVVPGAMRGASAVVDPTQLERLSEPQYATFAESRAKLFGIASTGIAFLDGDMVLLRAATGFPRASGRRDARLWDLVTRSDETSVIADLARVTGEALELCGQTVRFFIARPLRGAGGETFAYLIVADPEPRQFSIDELQKLEASAREIERTSSIARERERARAMQRTLRPRAIEAPPGYDLAGTCVPTRAMGGDFFDWMLDGSTITVTLGDVMGKGVASAIIAAATRATVRSAVHESAGVAVSRAADALADDLEDARTFVTLFHARVDTERGELEYVDAGHGLAVLVDPRGGAHPLRSEQLPLGVLRGEPFAATSTEFEAGAMLVVVSDGALEFGDGSLAVLDEVVELARRADSAHAAVDAIIQRAGPHVPDDVTVVVLRRSPSKEG